MVRETIAMFLDAEWETETVAGHAFARSNGQDRSVMGSFELVLLDYTHAGHEGASSALPKGDESQRRQAVAASLFDSAR